MVKRVVLARFDHEHEAKQWLRDYTAIHGHGARLAIDNRAMFPCLQWGTIPHGRERKAV
jgi:hypothetical protein